MRQRTVLRSAFAVLIAATLVEPSATALTCDFSACCSAAESPRMHHHVANAVTVSSPMVGCTMPGICARTVSAAVPQVANAFQTATADLDAPGRLVSSFRSFVAPPSAPPPRA